MRVTQIILSVYGLLFIGVGVTLTDPMGISDVRAVYGGLGLAAGALLLLCAAKREGVTGLRIQAFCSAACSSAV